MLYIRLIKFRISLIKGSFQEKLGELLVSLSYYPANNTLTLGVLKVKLSTLSHLENKLGEMCLVMVLYTTIKSLLTFYTKTT